MTISRYRVDRMDCSAEEQMVRMRLARLWGVERVRVDLAERTVTVDHSAEIAAVDAALDSLGLGSHYIGDGGEFASPSEPRRERIGLVIALVINAALFVGELGFGLVSRSMGLVADSLDMGADAVVYALSLAAVGTSSVRKNRLARLSGYLQLGLALYGLFEVVRRAIVHTTPPETTTMIVVSGVALIANLATMVVLHRVRSDEAHFQASWIFTANDTKVNLLVIAAAVAVMLTHSATPDLVAGAIIFVVVAGGARRILILTHQRSGDQ